ncbi:MAG: hypothetical protein HWN80_19200 [Candidatus Lokiarchaeota archaeon]|nr:hypothetical protein [Candidatus Lokiarchaeota archaeon]
MIKGKKKYYICLKYSGLDIPYIIETDLLFIIPSDYKQKLTQLLEICKENTNIPDITCEWDNKNEVYVLLKKVIQFNSDINNISEIIPKIYDFFISLIGLIFTNHLKLKTVNILELVDNNYRIVRIYDYIIKRELETTDPFIFGEDIHPGKLKSFLNESFNNVKDIHNINDFYYNFFLCWFLYKEGKTKSQLIHKISDYWICLEVLSTMYFKHIHNYNMKLFTKKQLRELQKNLKSFLQKIPRSELVCIEDLKDEFIDQVKDKLNNNISIRKKVKLFADKALLPNLRDLELSKSNLKEIYDIIDKFYKHRNNFFHNGILPDPNDKKFHEHMNCFCLLIERLLFSIIKSDKVKFYKRGKCFQTLIVNYPFEEIAITASFEEVNKFYKKEFEKHSELFSTVDELNQKHDIIKDIYNKSIEMVFRNDETNITQSVNLDLVYDYDQSFTSNKIEYSSIHDISESHSPIVLKTEIDTNLILKIRGFLSGYSKSASSNLIKIRVFIFPPYFEFNFN